MGARQARAARAEHGRAGALVVRHAQPHPAGRLDAAWPRGGGQAGEGRRGGGGVDPRDRGVAAVPGRGGLPPRPRLHYGGARRRHRLRRRPRRRRYRQETRRAHDCRRDYPLRFRGGGARRGGGGGDGAAGAVGRFADTRRQRQARDHPSSGHVGDGDAVRGRRGAAAGDPRRRLPPLLLAAHQRRLRRPARRHLRRRPRLGRRRARLRPRPGVRGRAGCDLLPAARHRAAAGAGAGVRRAGRAVGVAARGAEGGRSAGGDRGRGRASHLRRLNVGRQFRR
mmetsp:Transcript_50405/g.164705  ORF Transcript_50405/g.164705 Transcript_50405/m.164705 type:complete len:281 (+) Transcript_50405:431-1273(+)